MCYYRPSVLIRRLVSRARRHYLFRIHVPARAENRDGTCPMQSPESRVTRVIPTGNHPRSPLLVVRHPDRQPWFLRVRLRRLREVGSELS